jgi:hypothetical protein
VRIFFGPTSVGGESATVTVNGNASNSPTIFNVRGTGR